MVVMTAHSQITRIDDPTQPTYDRHGLKLHKRASALAGEYSDIIMYACMQTITTTEESSFGNKRNRAVSTGERICHTTPNPAYVAKNRYGLPDIIALEWDAISKALSTQQQKDK